MIFDSVENTRNEGLITYRDVVIDGFSGTYIEIPAGISTESMVVDTQAVYIFHVRGTGTLYVESVVDQEIVQHTIDISSEGSGNLITILGTGASYEFRSDEVLFLNVLILKT